MKINISEEVRNSKSLAGHIILHGLTEIMTLKQWGKWADHKLKGSDDIYSDIQLTVDGMPVPFMSFVRAWDMQTDDLMKKEVEKTISNRFSDVTQILYDLKKRIKPEIESRLEDWEKEEEVSDL